MSPADPPSARRDRRLAVVSAPFTVPPRTRGARTETRQRPRAATVDEATTATARPVGPSERLLAFDAVRERFGGIGTSLGRRVIGDLPIVPIGDRVFVRERSLDAYIVALDARARWDRWDPPT